MKKLFVISLIFLLSLSVYSIAAADSDNINNTDYDFNISDDQTIDLDDPISDLSPNEVIDINDSQEVDSSIDLCNSDINKSSAKNVLKVGDINSKSLGEEENPMITLKIDYMSTSGEGSSVSTSKNGWTITAKKLASSTGVKPENPSRYNFTYNNKRYVFNHWEEADTGVVVDADYKKPLTPNGTSYTAHYKAVYDITEPGSLRVNYIDHYAHGSGSENHTADNVDYKHTFRTPADIPEGAVFLYWEREDNQQKFNPGDTMTVTASEYAGKNLEINVYAVYDIKTVVTVDEVTDYTGNTVDVTASVEDAFGNSLNGGTATLTIDYDNPISGLAASAETYTVDVVDGKAVFKDIKLGSPGNYLSKVEYTGYSDPDHSQGRNDYLSSKGESTVNILKLNTTTESDDVSGTVGDIVDITADILDQNGNPVQNGTAILKVNGKEYKAEVSDGKAVFTGVELPSESTDATIDYEGNDYYNPSSTTIKITVTQPVPDDDGDDSDSGGDNPVPDDDSPKNSNSSGSGPVNPSSDSNDPASDSGHSNMVEQVSGAAIPVVGNPLFLAVLALLTLISVGVYNGKR